ncbi:MAG TPA: hypothetical protein VKV77_01415 [Methylovirgula sp.]|nr:hypothetical protein [Methylovirgula sp.]
MGRWIAAGAALLMASSLPASSAELVLVNLSGSPIFEFYISPCWGPHWGTNQVYGSGVQPSRSFSIADLPPGCYDLRVVFPLGAECVVTGAWLRRYTAWRVNWAMKEEALTNECVTTYNVILSGRRPWVP